MREMMLDAVHLTVEGLIGKCLGQFIFYGLASSGVANPFEDELRIWSVEEGVATFP